MGAWESRSNRHATVIRITPTSRLGPACRIGVSVKSLSGVYCCICLITVLRWPRAMSGFQAHGRRRLNGFGRDGRMTIPDAGGMREVEVLWHALPHTEIGSLGLRNREQVLAEMIPINFGADQFKSVRRSSL